MRRLFPAVIAAACAASVWAATQCPLFNASLPSPTLVRTLTADYIAVDSAYGSVTNPYAIDAAVHSAAPSTTSMVGIASWQPGLTISHAAEGVRYAQQAEAAVSALGATAELLPIRGELVRSYQDVAIAWRQEQYVELAFNNEPQVTLNLTGEAPSVQSAARSSVAIMQQARSLHDQAMAAVRALAGMQPAATVGQSGRTR